MSTRKIVPMDLGQVVRIVCAEGRVGMAGRLGTGSDTYVSHLSIGTSNPKSSESHAQSLWSFV